MNMQKPAYPPEVLRGMVACPQCDQLHRLPALHDGDRAACVRCGTVLFRPRAGAISLSLSLAVAALVLMTVAVSAPFLSMSAAGLSSSASVIDTVEAYSTGEMAPLSLAIAALILVLPTLRLLIQIYVLTPLVLHRHPWRGAKRLLRIDAHLRPWSMAEIFMVGVAVALVKIADLANLSFGPAFWAFGAVAVLFAAGEAVSCERTLWRILDRA